MEIIGELKLSCLLIVCLSLAHASTRDNDINDVLLWTSYDKGNHRPQINLIDLSKVFSNLEKINSQPTGATREEQPIPLHSVRKRVFSRNGESNFEKLASDARKNSIYWTSSDDRHIACVRNLNATGRNQGSILNIKTSRQVHGLAIDWINKNVYWADSGYKWIGMAPTDFAKTKYTAVVQNVSAYGISIHPSKCLLFWSDVISKSIERSTLSGEGRRAIVSNSDQRPGAMHVDPVDDKVYWVDTSSSQIWRSDLDGNDINKFYQVRAHGAIFSGHMGLAIYKDWLLSTSESVDRIYILHKKTKGYIGSIAASTMRHRDLEVIATSEQPLSETTCSQAECDHMCVGVSNEPGYKCLCSKGFELLEDGKSCQIMVQQDFIVLTTRNPSSIAMFDLTGEYVIPLPLKMGRSTENSPIAIDYDHVGKRIVWSDVVEKTIKSIDLEGNDVNFIKRMSRSSVVDGLAIDVATRYVYHTDTGLNRIGRVGLTGRNSKTLIQTNLLEPRAIALDPKERTMYWTDWGKHPKIEKANMDTGSGRNVLIETDIRCPNGLALDLTARLLFWCDCVLDKLEVALLDGSGRRVLVEETESHYFGLALDSTFIYISDWTSSAIKRFNRNSGELEPHWKEINHGSLCGVAIYRSNKTLHHEVDPVTPHTTTYSPIPPSTRINNNLRSTKTIVPILSTKTSSIKMNTPRIHTITAVAKEPLSPRPTIFHSDELDQSIDQDQDYVDFHRNTMEHTRALTTIICGTFGGVVLVIVVVAAIIITLVRKKRTSHSQGENPQITTIGATPDAPPDYDTNYHNTCMSMGAIGLAHPSKGAELDSCGMEVPTQEPSRERSDQCSVQLSPPDYEKDAPVYTELDKTTSTSTEFI